MKYPLGVLLFVIVLIYFIYSAYIVWFKTKKYMGEIHQSRVKIKNQIPFLPDWFVGYIFFYEKPGISIWWARIWTTIAIVICILGIIAASHGPF
jgi:hypothetical protein